MIAVGTRFWDKREGADPNQILRMVEQVSSFADRIFVAVNIGADQSGSAAALRNLRQKNLTVTEVNPWGYTFAMNALIYAADLVNERYLLSQSTEIRITEEMKGVLMEHMDDETLCVGARLRGHEFFEGRTVPGTGYTTPWNTCCLWNLRRLALVGFPLIGDSSFDSDYAGVEEVATISLLQRLFPDTCRAKLVQVTGIVWSMEDCDPKRRAEHRRLMKRNVDRGMLQLGLLGLPEPKIEHVR